MTDETEQSKEGADFRIRRATAEHLQDVIDLDARITGQPKPEFWQDIYDRYATRRVDQRFFLVAEKEGRPGILGLIAGEVRGWEFGSQPCGWVFAVSVDPEVRQRGIGEALFKEMCNEFRRAGMTTVRTMVRRQNPLHMSFFRSEGMMAGPYTQLEMNLDEG
ncbi:N-acetyltransferase family protein [Shimia sp.]|uniref:GNAT family N-acetyltransferase n=1 Tax=Shimia sp. TaxID=1954381 RepID=UPI003561861B